MTPKQFKKLLIKKIAEKKASQQARKINYQPIILHTTDEIPECQPHQLMVITE